MPSREDDPTLVVSSPPPPPPPPPFLAHKKLRGVSYDPITKKWRARLYCAGKHVTLGRLATALEAAHTHDRAAYFVFGEVAVTNFGTRLAHAHLQQQQQQQHSSQPTPTQRTMARLCSLKARLEARAAEVGGGGVATCGGKGGVPVSSSYLRWQRQLAAIRAGLPPALVMSNRHSGVDVSDAAAHMLLASNGGSGSGSSSKSRHVAACSGGVQALVCIAIALSKLPPCQG